jgi:hypothetical protein
MPNVGSRLSSFLSSLAPFRLVVFIVLIGASSFAFVVQRGQDANWDLLNYHFFQGHSILTGSVYQNIAPTHIQSFLNPTITGLVHLLNDLIFPLGALMILFIQLSVVPAIVLIAEIVAKRLGYPKYSLASLFAVALTLLSPLWISELGTSFFESWTASLIVWALFLILSHEAGKRNAFRLLGLAGVLLGLATGLKLTNAPFAVAGLLTIVWLASQVPRLAIRPLAVFSAGAVFGFLPTAWWHFYLASEWHNPVFPFFNDVFISKYYEEKYWRDTRWVFESPQDFLSFVGSSATGTSATAELSFADPRFFILSLLAALATLLFFFFRGPKLPRQLSGLLVFFGSSLILWASVFAYQRYFVPGELLMGLVAWVLISLILRSANQRLVALGVSILLSASLISVPDWGHVRPNFKSGNPLSVSVPQELLDSAAVYLPAGSRPLSFIFPSLHPGSSFHTFGLSPAIDARIIEHLRRDSRPIRSISLAEAKDSGISLLVGLGIDENEIECLEVTSSISTYAVCGLFPGTWSH